jgi:hypothetical protein
MEPPNHLKHFTNQLMLEEALSQERKDTAERTSV